MYHLSSGKSWEQTDHTSTWFLWWVFKELRRCKCLEIFYRSFWLSSYHWIGYQFLLLVIIIDSRQNLKTTSRNWRWYDFWNKSKSHWTRSTQLLTHMIHKINSRWITTLNIECETIKFLEENIEEYVHELTVNKDFLDWTLRGKRL